MNISEGAHFLLVLSRASPMQIQSSHRNLMCHNVKSAQTYEMRADVRQYMH